MVGGQERVVLEKRNEQDVGDVDVHAGGGVEADEGFRP